MDTQGNATHDAQVTTPVTGKTVFSFSAPTPVWATYVFRTEFVLNKALLMILGGTSLLNPNQIKESLLWIAAIDFAVWAFGRSIGIKKDQFEEA